MSPFRSGAAPTPAAGLRPTVLAVTEIAYGIRVRARRVNRPDPGSGEV
ncbi:hypothetical protein [Streptomyces sp. NPDC050564]